MPPAAIGRRIGTAFYDLLVVVALWMAVYFPLIGAGWFAGTLDDNRDPRHWLLRLAIVFAYFSFCWTRGGRTLGGQAWKQAIARHDGRPISFADATARFAVASAYLLPVVALEAAFDLAVPPLLFYPALLAPFLLGTLWALRDPQQRALHERFLVTRVIETQG